MLHLHRRGRIQHRLVIAPVYGLLHINLRVPVRRQRDRRLAGRKQAVRFVIKAVFPLAFRPDARIGQRNLSRKQQQRRFLLRLKELIRIAVLQNEQADVHLRAEIIGRGVDIRVVSAMQFPFKIHGAPHSPVCPAM